MKTIAIVGCGRIAARHAEILSNSEELNLKLVGVCDLLENRADTFSTKFGVPRFLDMDLMMRELQPDYVVVLTESGNHASHVLNLIQYGSDIIVEKPMALRIEDANRMIEECNKAKVKLFVIVLSP